MKKKKQKQDGSQTARRDVAKQGEADDKAAIRQPGKFPALFDDFVRQIVNARTFGLSKKRFCDYLRHKVKRAYDVTPLWKESAAKFYLKKLTPAERRDRKWSGMTKQGIGETLLDVNLQKTVDVLLADWQRGGFPTHYLWNETAKDYLQWWAGQKSAKARAAAKKSKQSS